MGKLKTKIINRFDGGIIDDIREETNKGFQISTHFDIFTNPLRLTPYRDTEANETKAQKIIKFLYGNGKLYGLGVVSGQNYAKIFEKASNPITDSWTASTSGESSAGDRNEDVFFYYNDGTQKNLFGWRAGTHLWKYQITGTPAFTDAYQAITYTNVAQPVIHPADDIAYFAHDNKISTLNATSFSASALVLPENLIITDLEPWGNLLAIACKPKNAGEKSVVFLWDRDSSVTTLTDEIDWGEGDLLYIANLDGQLIGITDYFLNDGTLNADRGKLIIKKAAPQKARTVKEIQKTADDTTTFIPNPGTTAASRTKILKDNKIFFPVAASDQSETWRGVAVVDSRGVITMDLVEEDCSSSGIQGIFLLGNYWFIAHSNDGSVNRINNSALYTNTSVYQSQKYTLGDASITKKLLGATVMTAPLPTAGQVVLKYRKNEETTWTTIFTEATDNSISFSAINTASGTLPEYKEIQFRIESTGGAEITGLKFKSEVIDKDIY